MTLQAFPAPTLEEFLAAELPPTPSGSFWSSLRPGRGPAARRRAQARYRQACQAVQELEPGPFHPEIVWRRFHQYSWRDLLSLRLYYLLPGLPGESRYKKLAQALRKNRRPLQLGPDPLAAADYPTKTRQPAPPEKAARP